MPSPAARPLCIRQKKLPSGVGVRYLYQPGKLEGIVAVQLNLGGPWKCTDMRSVTKPEEQVFYNLQDGPHRVPGTTTPDTQLPPDGVLRR